MRGPTKYLIFSLILIAGFSCKKEPGTGTGAPGMDNLYNYSADTVFHNNFSFRDQDRNVLIHEFTGVWCYTCPLAHDTVAKIINLYPDRVFALNVHSHYYSIYDDPAMMGNLYDIRTLDGDSIVNMLGGVVSVPSGSIDMTVMPSESSIINFNRWNWVDYVDGHLAANPNPDVNVEVVTEYDSTTRNLKVISRYHIKSGSSDPVYYSIAIADNGIVDKQYVDTAVVEFYEQKHILRDYLTNPRGDFMATQAVKGDIFIRTNYITVPLDWNQNDLEVIAYCHNSGTDFTVHQSNNAYLNE